MAMYLLPQDEQDDLRREEELIDRQVMTGLRPDKEYLSKKRVAKILMKEVRAQKLSEDTANRILETMFGPQPETNDIWDHREAVLAGTADELPIKGLIPIDYHDVRYLDMEKIRLASQAIM